MISWSFAIETPAFAAVAAASAARRCNRHREEIVDELQRMAMARWTHVDHVLAVGTQHGPKLREDGVVGADHRVEPALLGFPRRAREWCVDEFRVLRREIGPDCRSRCRLGRRRVDDDQALSRGPEQTIGAVDDRLDLRRPGHAEKDDIRSVRQVRRSLGFRRTGGDDVLQRLAVAVGEHLEREPLGDDVLRHAVAHQPEADEADARLRVRGSVHRCTPTLAAVATAQPLQCNSPPGRPGGANGPLRRRKGPATKPVG